jgi:hypothetical protein
MIQRYCISYGELAKADFDGGLVMYEDYIKLESQNKALRELVGECIKSFGMVTLEESPRDMYDCASDAKKTYEEKLREIGNA